MTSKSQHLKAISEAYHKQGEVTSIVGLHLTEPFAGSKDSAELAATIWTKSNELEEMLRHLYRLEVAVERP